MKEKVSRIARIAWLYTKYQVLTKVLLFALVTPAYSYLLNSLIRSTGRTNISSGDYLSFLFSIQGIGFLALALGFFIILLALDINAFIIVSALIEEDRVYPSARNIILVSIKSLKNFLKPAGLFIVLYIAIIVPLVSIGFSISATKNFKIPNFITDVIYKNPLYLSAYTVAIIILTIISFIHLFTFHFILIKGDDIFSALKNARIFMRKNLKRFLVDFFRITLSIYIPIGLILLVFLILVYSPLVFVESKFLSRFILFFASSMLLSLSSYVALLSLPITITVLTMLYYRYHRMAGEEIHINIEVDEKAKYLGKFDKYKLSPKKAISIFIILTVLVNILASLSFAYIFEDVIKQNKDIEIVAHRAGGNYAVENSLLGLEKAIEAGAKVAEIDVQRTKDDFYVINHDSTFNRLAGVNKASSDMTLEEIKTIELQDLFDKTRANEKVATMEEFLDAAKGRIKLYIELKGSTADMQMAEDVLAMVNERNMLDEIALISLDYNLIQNIEEKYPEVETGYLYFFSVGSVDKMIGDILIMEEEMASASNIDKIHTAGKKAVVWTVNSKESADRFVKSEVDGIITDYVDLVKDSIKERDERSDLDIIIDTVFSN